MTGPAPDQDIQVSFELFPPKTERGMTNLARTVDRLTGAGPDYFSVTYGAGGGTRDRTRKTVEMVAARTGLPVAHHLTCVESSRREIDTLARGLWRSGIRKVVALRGDPPGGETFTVPDEGYPYAADLVAGLRRIADFEIAVAAFPEIHPEALSGDDDIDNLKRKLDAGATKAITQFAFETDTVLRFIDRARAAGIEAPIVPGIMPVANFASLKRFAAGCGAGIPDWMERMFAGLDDAPELRSMVATSVAAEQCRRLAEAGLAEFHIYTLNKADVTLALLRSLGRPTEIAAAKNDAA